MAMAAQYHSHLLSYLSAAAMSFLLAITLAPLATGDPLGQICGTSGNYTANSTYLANIQLLASTLPKNASSSSTLFAKSQIGTVPDMVYALALCRGDAPASACGDCVATAFQDAQQLCAPNKDATIFYDLCLLRYSNQNFLSPPTSDGRGTALILMNTQNVTSPFRVFDAAVGVLLNATADYAAANSSRRFGTAVEGFQTFDRQNPRIYGLAQCTSDMAPADCRNCLADILQLRLEYFSGKQGGRILGLRCNYRYEQYSFFPSPLLQLPEPPVGAPPAPAPPANVTPPAAGGVCGDSGYFAQNSTYQSNLALLSTILPRNASSSPALFAAGEVGSAPDMIYALTLCRGDKNASACGSCVAAAFRDAQQLCAYNKDATVYYDACYLRFSNARFLADARNDNAIFLMDSRNVSSPVRPFDAAVGVLLNATADYAAADSSRRFGTAVEGFQTFDSRNPWIYGLAQCTPDMAPADCRSCLAGILQSRLKDFSGRQGGRILGLRCNYRYERYSFFTGSPLLQMPEPPVGAPAAPAPPANVTPPAAGGGSTGNKTGKILAIALPIVAALLATVMICCCIWRRKRKTPGKPSLPDTTNPEDVQSINSLIIDISTLRAATANFDQDNKLGEGGFGAVYKGILPDDQEIAVKRLSQSSRQGIEELKNELVLVAKLQHKNLVRLVGVCLEDHEKLLVYEYMPNKSLDTVLFDPEKRIELDWGKRFKIVNRIARGLQYLHEDSQVKIIHRDLKASNVLLDHDYNPKISDFGLARLFGSNQTQHVTNRVVGTYGYMAPEYAMRGHYSIKSDVFSFGVLILEIVTGRRNGGSYSSEDSAYLLSLVWEHWTTGTLMEIMDSSLSSLAPRDQMVKCIQIGLLCVQDDPMDRPMMSMVNVMLSSNTVTLNTPSKPVFCIPKDGTNSDMYRASQSASRSPMSQNEISVTELEPR